MTDATPYTVPSEPGRWRAITLATLVHGILLVFLWIGIRWQNETPATVEAEIWNMQPREAAPLPQPVQESEPKPLVRQPPKPAVEEKPVVKQPDIALEQEKKRKLEEKKRLEEEQRLAELRRKQEEQKRLDKEKVEKERKLAAEKKRQQEEADKQLLAKAREDEMRRITGGVTSGGSGDAVKSQGVRGDPSYAQRVAAKIKSNITFHVPDELPGNPPVEYEVRLLPDGSLAGMRKTRPSGVPGFDEAVARAIEKSQPYPKDKSGSVPSTFIGIHKPKDP